MPGTNTLAYPIVSDKEKRFYNIDTRVRSEGAARQADTKAAKEKKMKIFFIFFSKIFLLLSPSSSTCLSSLLLTHRNCLLLYPGQGKGQNNEFFKNNVYGRGGGLADMALCHSLNVPSLAIDI